MMKHVLGLIWLLLCAVHNPAAAEEVPLPPTPAAHHYIEIPSGGLKAFMAWTPMRIPLISHHRGGPAPGFPENAIETMQNALRYGPGLMEVDVAQLGDGTLVLMHDDTIDRTTTGSGRLEDLSWQDVAPLYLEDASGQRTGFRVPKLEDVLSWATGKAILTLDIKRGVDFTKVVAAVEAAGAQDYVIAISYTLEQALAFQKAAPNMMQTVTMRNADELAAVLASGLTRENIVAWTGTRLAGESHYQAIHSQGWRVVAGTLGSRETANANQILKAGNDGRYLEIYAMGADIIATDRFWAVQAQVRNPNIFVFTRSRLYR
jgi:glycerophosphoryl diester phosphodiesterase